MKKTGLTYDQALNFLVTGIGTVVHYNRSNNPQIELVDGAPINVLDNSIWICKCGCMRKSLWSIATPKPPARPRAKKSD